MNKTRIKVFVVTYNRKKQLEKCLCSLLESDLIDFEYSIFVLNNHSPFELSTSLTGKNIKILNNQARPNFSTGHLSRSWNQAILNGFVDLNNPSADFVITVQDDVEVEKNCFKNLMCYHNSHDYNFISVGTGDDFMSFTPDAIKSVGLFDERFCNIGFQHMEYFARHVAFNRKKCSVNDFYHNCIHNPIYPPWSVFLSRHAGSEEKNHDWYNGYNDLIKLKQCGFMRGDEGHMDALRYHSYASEFMRSKWAVNDRDLINMYSRKNIPRKVLDASDYPHTASVMKSKMFTGIGFKDRGLGKSAYSPFTSGVFEDWHGDPYGVFARALSSSGFICMNPQPILYPYFECDIENRLRIGYAQ